MWEISAGDRLLFIGDSITDCGRDRPVGMLAGLGSGYVNLVHGMMGAWRPEAEPVILNLGISGNRVTDLRDRWQQDVLDLKPDWISVMIGINDVWRHFDRPHEVQSQVGEETYEVVYDQLITQTLPHVKGMIILPPFYLEPNKDEPMRAMMDRYGNVARKLANKHGCLFGDVQAAFDRYMAVRPTQRLCGDRVHPGLTGHMIIARCFLETIGFNWSA